jgi:hypothetical protein
MELVKGGRLASARDFAKYYVPLLALVPFVLLVLMWVLPVFTESGFDGVWFKKTGDKQMPSEMKVRIQNGKFKETFPAKFNAEYETVTLELDGHEHAWTGGSLFEDGRYTTYTAQLNGAIFSVVKHQNEWPFQEGNMVELWTLRNKGRELVVSSTSSETVYEHASWLREFITNEP